LRKNEARVLIESVDVYKFTSLFSWLLQKLFAKFRKWHLQLLSHIFLPKKTIG